MLIINNIVILHGRIQESMCRLQTFTFSYESNDIYFYNIWKSCNERRDFNTHISGSLARLLFSHIVFTLTHVLNQKLIRPGHKIYLR